MIILKPYYIYICTANESGCVYCIVVGARELVYILYIYSAAGGFEVDKDSGASAVRLIYVGSSRGDARPLSIPLSLSLCEQLYDYICRRGITNTFTSGVEMMET